MKTRMVRHYATNHFCPICKNEDNVLRMLYIDSNDNTDLLCRIHGYQYEADSSSTYSWLDDGIKEPEQPEEGSIPKVGKAKVGRAKVK